jgi:hypothetical protein
MGEFLRKCPDSRCLPPDIFGVAEVHYVRLPRFSEGNNANNQTYSNLHNNLHKPTQTTTKNYTKTITPIIKPPNLNTKATISKQVSAIPNLIFSQPR